MSAEGCFIPVFICTSTTIKIRDFSSMCLVRDSAVAFPHGLEISWFCNFKGKGGRREEILHLFVILHEIELFKANKLNIGITKLSLVKLRDSQGVQPNSLKFLHVLTYLTKSYTLHKDGKITSDVNKINQ